jgi:uncharacterized membrane protein YkvA (DUF1232 family)
VNGRLASWAATLKAEIVALTWAIRHPDTPWLAKALAFLVVAYAVSPIDLIPDPIPVLGYLDDLILLPLGVLLTRRLIPQSVMSECRAQAERSDVGKAAVVGAVAVILVWLAIAAVAARWLIAEWS